MPCVTLAAGEALSDPLVDDVVWGVGVELFELLPLPLHAVNNRDSMAIKVIARHTKARGRPQGSPPLIIPAPALTMNDPSPFFVVIVGVGEE